MLGLLLLIAAIVCFGLATLNVRSPVNLVAAGLLCLAVRELL